MRLPMLDELMPEQRALFRADPDLNLFVVGPPGSGKTSVAILRAQYLLNLDNGVVLITRNRMLSSLADQLGEGKIKTSTMSSFFTKVFYDKFGVNAPEDFPFEYNWSAIMTRYQNARSVGKVGHIIIDEAQNLPAGFIAWAVEFGAEVVTVFADEDQTTDRLNSSIEQICSAGLPDPVRLIYNHRNTQEIADVAEFFHRGKVLPPAIARRGRLGETPSIIPVVDWSDFAKVVATRLANRGESIGVIVYRQVEVDRLYEKIKLELPAGSRVDAYTNAMGAQAARIVQSLAPGVTILTGESVIGLEFDTVFLQDLDRSLPCQYSEQWRRMYMLCARARDSLFVVNGPAILSQAQIQSLPQPPILE